LKRPRAMRTKWSVSISNRPSGHETATLATRRRRYGCTQPTTNVNLRSLCPPRRKYRLESAEREAHRLGQCSGMTPEALERSVKKTQEGRRTGRPSCGRSYALPKVNV
jgi:hypothetical protein